MNRPTSRDRWAHLRFSVVGPLLASPPAPGELRLALEKLAATRWKDPVSGERRRFGVSTIERWYYTARSASDPVGALRRAPRRDRGRQQAFGVRLAEELVDQHREHPRWSYQLHMDNLAARVKKQPSLGSIPSYATVRRYMVRSGLLKRRRRPDRELTDGEIRARKRLESREVRSYETKYVNGLWHLDFHNASRKIITATGEWVRPVLFTVLDDRSRLACHAQWYLRETAENLVHGLIQAICKRGLPRALMSDNGSAMLAAETTQGLARLSVVHQTTLPYSPYQNGKQEAFWGSVEGRLLAMLEGEVDLSLSVLNTATQAWAEGDYQRRVHSETRQQPLERWLEGPSVARRCPDLDVLRLAFTASKGRTQRKSDGTISLLGRRFEVPGRYRHMRRLEIRFASWDLSAVWLMDEHSGVVLDRLYPLDKTKNADGVRRLLDTETKTEPPPDPAGIAPLLRELMAEYAATGLPPAYIPQEDS